MSVVLQYNAPFVSTDHNVLGHSRSLIVEIQQVFCFCLFLCTFRRTQSLKLVQFDAPSHSASFGVLGSAIECSLRVHGSQFPSSMTFPYRSNSTKVFVFPCFSVPFVKCSLSNYHSSIECRILHLLVFFVLPDNAPFR